MKIKIITFILLSITVFYNSGIAGFNKAGRTSVQFLKIGLSAREAALGEACIANITDVNAVFWNPAGITGLYGGEVAFNYARWIGDLNIMSAALAYNISDIGVLGLDFIGLDYGDLQEALVTSPTGNLDTRTGNTFTGNDMAIGFTFARKFTDKLAIGIKVKYIQEKLFSYTTSVWGLDVGSTYDTGWKGIRLAMTAQNFAKQARFLETKEEFEQTYELPLVFRIGWSIDLLGKEDLFLGSGSESHSVTINMDAIHTNDYAERLHLGLEYWLLGKYALRGGYRFNYEEGNLSIGTGLKYPIGTTELVIDYSYVDYNFLETTHRISVIFSF